MKKIKEKKKVEYFQELSKKEKQKISGGGLSVGSALLREIIAYVIPKQFD